MVYNCNRVLCQIAAEVSLGTSGPKLAMIVIRTQGWKMSITMSHSCLTGSSPDHEKVREITQGIQKLSL